MASRGESRPLSSDWTEQGFPKTQVGRSNRPGVTHPERETPLCVAVLAESLPKTFTHTGGPTKGQKYRPRGEPLEARLWAGVDRSGGALACWPWTGKTTRDGYGRINWRDRLVLAHKAALEIKLGRTLAPGEVSRHMAVCRGNRACCNPAHLESGTPQDNADDMVRDGNSLRGERGPSAKLTEVQATEILSLAGALSYEAIGRRYGVTGKTVSMIVSGQRWPHLTRTTSVQP